MSVDDALVRSAREAQTTFLERDYEADRARLAFQHAVRRLHASGATLREIAQALSLSHQRVHQIVEGAEGKLALKASRVDLACSFCGRDKSATAVLVAGPGGVFACDRCIAAAAAALVADSPGADVQLVEGAACSFCGRITEATVRRETGSVGMCRDCVTAAQQIVSAR